MTSKKFRWALLFALICVLTLSMSCDALLDKPVDVTGVTLGQNNQMLEVGQTLQLTVTVAPADATDKTVTYASSDATVASVSNTGLVTALKKGNATITVTTTDGAKTDTIVITVLDGYVRATLTSNSNPTLTYEITSGPHEEGSFETLVTLQDFETPFVVSIPAGSFGSGSPAMTILFASAEPADMYGTFQFKAHDASSTSLTYFYFQLNDILENIALNTAIAVDDLAILTQDATQTTTQYITCSPGSATYPITVTLTDKGETSGYLVGTITGTVFDTTNIDTDTEDTEDGVPYDIAMTFKARLGVFPTP
ncbi:MAG: Ig-like domain-containing protein [Sphaerochaeta associata]|uniref:Ig-like domain-containing protein n=1 Tax=Sphaerochaeta associata TaxID=1129264 RepID=UPI002B1F65F6|nr:Ig-like domain-containing protein [Sphaerochaeta associata]MEA5107869.1 Ig-like domain-containing protein [Sphaerochaeta associata]